MKHLTMLNNEDDPGELKDMFERLNDSVIVLLDKIASKHDQLIENVESYRKKSTFDIMKELNSSHLSLKNKRVQQPIYENSLEDDVKLLGSGIHF